MKSMSQRRDEQRGQKLEDVRRQVADGSLVIRQMTTEERKRYPPRERTGKRP